MNIDFYLRPQQREIYDHLRRFNVLVAHRRFGKTVFAVMLLLIKALDCKHKRPQVHYYCPSYSQAKRVAWQYVKEFSENMGAIYNESADRRSWQSMLNFFEEVFS